MGCSLLSRWDVTGDAKLIYKVESPKGLLMPLSGDDIKTEAWILRNLVTVLAGAARRPHVPRCPEMRTLFRAIGIDVPENLAKEEDAGSLAASRHLGAHRSTSTRIYKV